MKKIKELMSIQIAQKPGKMVVLTILSFNILFVMIASIIISSLSLDGTESMGFFRAAFCTITMILDPGCIQFVVQDIGEAGVAITVACLAIVIIGMISFTGAVIGYLTNYISDFIKEANAGERKLVISDHTVILNWNTRASEIVNDLLYCEEKQKVVVLVQRNKSEIEKELNERLTFTVNKENAEIYEKNRKNGKTVKYGFAKKYTDKLTLIIREGDVFSSKQLQDISLSQAKSVIILGNEKNNSFCTYKNMERNEELQKGNSQTIKTVMQVADITSADNSADNQKIIVEITDDWTWELVSRIIEYKEVRAKCNIVPVRVNKVLGQLLSQFSLMPELNMVYKELFSNKGMAFYSEPKEDDGMPEEEYVIKYLGDHRESIPLTFMESGGKKYYYYAAEHEGDIQKKHSVSKTDYKVALNHDYWMKQKNIIILGHNSKILSIMDGFASFRNEWGFKDSDKEILNLLIIDDEKNLKKMDYYRQYDFTGRTVSATIYDREIICDEIERFVSSNKEDTSILILSDDEVQPEETDAGALANLVYVQDIVNKKRKIDPNFKVETMDIIVEIIDPKHHDIVSNYSVNNVVISNRYISKMITQIGEKEALFDFYADILTYDDDTSDGYDSKEIYTKKVSELFETIPKRASAAELIRAIYVASIDKELPEEKRNPTIAIGYINKDDGMVLFGGDQEKTEVDLQSEDLLVVFSNH